MEEAQLGDGEGRSGDEEAAEEMIQFASVARRDGAFGKIRRVLVLEMSAGQVQVGDANQPSAQGSCQPLVMSHSLPHRTLTTSTSSLSPIASSSPIFPTVSPAHTGSMALRPKFTCDVPRQSGGSTQIPSLKQIMSKLVEINAIETEAIESEDLEPRRIEFWD